MSYCRQFKCLALPFLAVAALGGLLATAGCGGKSQTSQAESKDVRCTVGQVGKTAIPHFIQATGSLQADKTVMVSTRMMGWVKKIHVREGQRVSKGDPLLSIDDTDLRAKQAQAEAGLAEARAVLANAEKMAERFTNLYADHSVSKQQLDDVLTGRDRAAAGVRMAEAGLAELKVHLAYLDITAPGDGVVGRKMIEEGDMANPGLPLLILEDTDNMKVVAHVGEKDVASVHVGSQVSVEISSLPAADGPLRTTLTKVVPTANPGSRTYDIEAELPNESGLLKSGMFARVRIQTGQREAVLVPAEAVIRRGQLTGVWVVDPAMTVRLRWIRLGYDYGSSCEVLSGLEGGETIVLSHEQPLAEGDRVVN